MKKTTDSVSLPTHTHRIWGDFRRCFRLGRMPRRGIFARVENQAGSKIKQVKEAAPYAALASFHSGRQCRPHKGF